MEVMNMLDTESARGLQSTAVVMYHRFDRLQLERVVGAARADKMLAKAKGTSTFVFW
jgi:sigma54-dependent transcription regulator